MNKLQKVELGVVVTLVLAALSFAFWLGGRLESLEQRITRLEASPAILSTQGQMPVKKPQTDSNQDRPTIMLTLESEVNPKDAPFEIELSGTVTKATSMYTYVVVDDGNAEWIQPGLGENRDGSFYTSAYLGLEKGNDSLNKWYTIFAIVTNEEHKAYQHLIPASVQVRTKPIRVFRTH
jgi:hypothetical protein